MSHDNNVVFLNNTLSKSVSKDWTNTFNRYRSNHLNLIPLHLQRVRDDIYESNYDDLNLFLNIGELYDKSEYCNSCRGRASCFLKCINWFKKTSFCYLCNICHKSFCLYCIIDIEIYKDGNTGFKSKACSNCYIFVKEILEIKYKSMIVDSVSMDLVELQKKTANLFTTLDSNTRDLARLYKRYKKLNKPELVEQISIHRKEVVNCIKELNHHRLLAISMNAIDHALFLNNMKKSYLNYIKFIAPKYVKNAYSILVDLGTLGF